VDDYLGVNPSCQPVRESLSALMDREWPTLGRDEVMAHLADCAQCRRWQDQAWQATRRARLAVPQPPAALAETLLASLGGRRWSRWRLPLQLLLAAVGWGVAVFALPALVYGIDAEAPPHVAHELGSLNVAIGLTLVLAAFRPGLAGGVLPLVGAVVGLLVLTAGDDILRGSTTWRNEAPHALMVAGLVLLIAIKAVQRPGRGPGSRPRARGGDPAGDRATPLATHRRPSRTDQQAPRRRAI
jgi:predicted anti-sigma-YlaC factor YlaD